jgi:peptide/nickel transport system permease protein
LTIPLLWGVVTLIFLSVRLIPGDPVQIMYAGHATAAQIAAERRRLGFDQPLPVQYWSFITHAAHLDFGASIRSGRPVWAEIMERVPYTVQLAVAALALGVVLGLLLGVSSALFNRTWVGTGIVGATLLGISIPDFCLGTMLALVVGVELRWLPVAGTGGIQNLILPAVTLGVGVGAVLARMVRTSCVGVLSAEYVTVATAKGLRRPVVLWHHVLRNGLLPPLTVFGLIVTYLLSGVVIVETVFAWPGLGSYAVSAVEARDFPAIEGITFFFAAIVIGANLLVDISYGLLDPRVRYS